MCPQLSVCCDVSAVCCRGGTESELCNSEWNGADCCCYQNWPLIQRLTPQLHATRAIS